GRCTTASTSSWSPPSSSRPQDPGEQLRQQQVEAVEVEAEEDGGGDDDHGGAVDLLTAGPGDLPQLALHLREEGSELAQLLRPPAQALGQPLRLPPALLVVHLSRLCDHHC